ncbi:MAG: GNAT family N-acetyltransferase [Cytophagales bacterium]|nr:GNAT family N-acetyltransferase [Cytophagales bacterium]
MHPQTNNLAFRRFKLSDLDSFHETQLTCQLPRRHPYKQGISESASKFLEALQQSEDKCRYWALEEAVSGVFLGYCKLCRNSKDEIEIDYDLLGSAKKLGFEKVILSFLACYAFSQLKQQSVNCTANKKNGILLHALEELGFQQTAAVSSSGNETLLRYKLNKSTFIELAEQFQ